MSSKLTSTGTKKSKLLTSTASVSEKPSRIPQGRVYSINNFKNSTHTCPEKPTFRRPSLSSWRPEAKAELLSSNSTSDLSDQASGTSSHESSSLEQMLELCNNTSSSSKNEILTRASTSDSSVELQAHLVSKKTPEYTAKKQSLRSGRNQLKRLCSGSKEFVRKRVKGSSSTPSTTISESLFDSSLNAHDKTRAGKKLTRTKREFVSRKASAKQKKKKLKMKAKEQELSRCSFESLDNSDSSDLGLQSDPVSSDGTVDEGTWPGTDPGGTSHQGEQWGADTELENQIAKDPDRTIRKNVKKEGKERKSLTEQRLEFKQSRMKQPRTSTKRTQPQLSWKTDETEKRLYNTHKLRANKGEQQKLMFDRVMMASHYYTPEIPSNTEMSTTKPGKRFLFEDGAGIDLTKPRSDELLNSEKYAENSSLFDRGMMVSHYYKPEIPGNEDNANKIFTRTVPDKLSRKETYDRQSLLFHRGMMASHYNKPEIPSNTETKTTIPRKQFFVGDGADRDFTNSWSDELLNSEQFDEHLLFFDNRGVMVTDYYKPEIPSNLEMKTTIPGKELLFGDSTDKDLIKTKSGEQLNSKQYDEHLLLFDRGMMASHHYKPEIPRNIEMNKTKPGKQFPYGDDTEDLTRTRSDKLLNSEKYSKHSLSFDGRMVASHYYKQEISNNLELNKTITGKQFPFGDNTDKDLTRTRSDELLNSEGYNERSPLFDRAMIASHYCKPEIPSSTETKTTKPGKQFLFGDGTDKDLTRTRYDGLLNSERLLFDRGMMASHYYKAAIPSKIERASLAVGRQHNKEATSDNLSKFTSCDRLKEEHCKRQSSLFDRGMMSSHYQKPEIPTCKVKLTTTKRTKTSLESAASEESSTSVRDKNWISEASYSCSRKQFDSRMHDKQSLLLFDRAMMSSNYYRPDIPAKQKEDSLTTEVNDLLKQQEFQRNSTTIPPVLSENASWGLLSLPSTESIPVEEISHITRYEQSPNDCYQLNTQELDPFKYPNKISPNVVQRCEEDNTLESNSKRVNLSNESAEEKPADQQLEYKIDKEEHSTDAKNRGQRDIYEGSHHLLSPPAQLQEIDKRLQSDVVAFEGSTKMQLSQENQETATGKSEKFQDELDSLTKADNSEDRQENEGVPKLAKHMQQNQETTVDPSIPSTSREPFHLRRNVDKQYLDDLLRKEVAIALHERQSNQEVACAEDCVDLNREDEITDVTEEDPDDKNKSPSKIESIPNVLSFVLDFLDNDELRQKDETNGENEEPCNLSFGSTDSLFWETTTETSPGTTDTKSANSSSSCAEDKKQKKTAAANPGQTTMVYEKDVEIGEKVYPLSAAPAGIYDQDTGDQWYIVSNQEVDSIISKDKESVKSLPQSKVYNDSENVKLEAKDNLNQDQIQNEENSIVGNKKTSTFDKTEGMPKKSKFNEIHDAETFVAEIERLLNEVKNNVCSKLDNYEYFRTPNENTLPEQKAISGEDTKKVSDTSFLASSNTNDNCLKGNDRRCNYIETHSAESLISEKGGLEKETQSVETLETLNKLEKKLKSKEEDLRVMKKLLEDSRQDYEELQGSFDSFSKEFEQVEENRAVVSKLKRENSTLKKEQEELLEEIQQQNQTNLELTEVLQECHDQMKRLEKQLTGSEEVNILCNFDVTKQEDEGLIETNVCLKDGKNKNQNEEGRLSSKETDNTCGLVILGKGSATLQEKVETFLCDSRKHIADLEAENVDLRNQVERSVKDIGILKAQIEHPESEVINLDKQANDDNLCTNPVMSNEENSLLKSAQCLSRSRSQLKTDKISRPVDISETEILKEFTQFYEEVLRLKQSVCGRESLNLSTSSKRSLHSLFDDLQAMDEIPEELTEEDTTVCKPYTIGNSSNDSTTGSSLEQIQHTGRLVKDMIKELQEATKDMQKYTKRESSLEKLAEGIEDSATSIAELMEVNTDLKAWLEEEEERCRSLEAMIISTTRHNENLSSHLDAIEVELQDEKKENRMLLAKLNEDRTTHSRELNNLTKDAQRKEKQYLELQRDLDRLWEEKQELQFELSIERSANFDTEQMKIQKEEHSKTEVIGLKKLLQQKEKIISQLGQAGLASQLESGNDTEPKFLEKEEECAHDLKDMNAELMKNANIITELEAEVAGLRTQLNLEQESVRERVKAGRSNEKKKTKDLDCYVEDLRSELRQKDKALKEYEEHTIELSKTVNQLELQQEEKENILNKEIETKLALRRKVEETEKLLGERQEQVMQANQQILFEKMEKQTLTAHKAALEKELELSHQTALRMSHEKDTADREVRQLIQENRRFKMQEHQSIAQLRDCQMDLEHTRDNAESHREARNDLEKKLKMAWEGRDRVKERLIKTEKEFQRELKITREKSQQTEREAEQQREKVEELLSIKRDLTRRASELEDKNRKLKDDKESLEERIEVLKQEQQYKGDADKAALCELERRTSLETKTLKEQMEDLRKKLHESQEVIHRQSQLHQELDTNPRSHRTKIRKLQHKLDKYKVLDRVQAERRTHLEIKLQQTEMELLRLRLKMEQVQDDQIDADVYEEQIAEIKREMKYGERKLTLQCNTLKQEKVSLELMVKKLNTEMEALRKRMAEQSAEHMQLKTDHALLELKQRETASRANQSQALLDHQRRAEEELVTKNRQLEQEIAHMRRATTGLYTSSYHKGMVNNTMFKSSNVASDGQFRILITDKLVLGSGNEVA